MFFNKSKLNSRTPKKVALVLGGGGARGFAHIGAIRAFEEAGLAFDFCVGTSAGSIVGALYSARVSALEMHNYAATLDIKNVHNGNFLSPNDSMKIGKIVTDLIGDAMIEDLPRRFYAVAVDLCSARQIIFEKGKVGQAVSASSCVPMFFRPLELDDKHLVDGGLLNNIPAETARMLGAEKVVTVDINPTRGSGTTDTGMIDVLKATFAIMSKNASLQGLIHSDVIIAPDLSKFKATSKDGFEEMIELGYNAAKEKIDAVKALYI